MKIERQCMNCNGKYIIDTSIDFAEGLRIHCPSCGERYFYSREQIQQFVTDENQKVEDIRRKLEELKQEESRHLKKLGLLVAAAICGLAVIAMITEKTGCSSSSSSVSGYCQVTNCTRLAVRRGPLTGQPLCSEHLKGEEEAARLRDKFRR